MKLSACKSLNNICEFHYSQNRYTQHFDQRLNVLRIIYKYYFEIFVYILIIYLPFGIFTFFHFIITPHLKAFLIILIIVCFKNCY